MSEFKIRVEIPEFFEKIELFGHWNYDNKWGVVMIYDSISKVVSINADNFEEFSRIFAKIKKDLQENPKEFAFKIYGFQESVRNLGKETFYGMEA